MKEINLKNIPDDLHRDLKVAAAMSGTTMREFILDTLAAAIAKTRKTR